MTDSVRIAIVVIAVGVSACRDRAHEVRRAAPAASGPVRTDNLIRFDVASPQLERIRVADVTSAVLPVDEFEIPGKVEARPTHLARLALPMAGRVRQVAVTLGDRVRSGQMLLTVETPESSTLLSAWRQVQADVIHRQAALTKAEADATRARDLLANRAIAQKDVVTAEAALAEAVAALEQARATQDDVARRLRVLGVNAGEQDAVATLRSPMDGEVIEISIAPGEYRSDTAAPVLTVADLARVWVVGALPERTLGQVRTGEAVTITLSAYPGQTFEGKVARLASALDPETRTARLIVELDNPRRLMKPEMFARVRYAGSPRPVVTIPVGAVVQDERRASVFVECGRGQFERRDIALGPRRDSAVLVTSGLTAGDRIVVAGTMLLMGQ